MKSFHFLLRLTWYLGLLTTLSGCETIPSAYGIPVPELGNLTTEQRKSLQENYYLIPKGHYPLTYGSGYTLPSYRYDNSYHDTHLQMELARQHWEASQPEPAPVAPPSSSFECSAASPCKQFKER